MSDTLVLPYEVVCEDTSKLGRSKWLELRKTGLGSTDAAPACGLSPWVSQYTLWAEKSGYLAEQDDKDRWIMGREFEEPLMRLWALREGIAWESIQRHVMARSIEFPYMLANPDGMVGYSPDEPVLEVKTCSEFDAPRWDLGVPDQYVMQAFHLMLVTGRRKCIFVVAFGWNYPIGIEIDIDDAAARVMAAVEGEMWRRIVENDAPDADGSDSSMKSLREQYYAVETGTIVDLPAKALGLIEGRELAVAAMKPHKQIEKDVKGLLMQMLGNAENGRIGQSIVVTYKARKDGARVMLFPDRSA